MTQSQESVLSDRHDENTSTRLGKSTYSEMPVAMRSATRQLIFVMLTGQSSE